MNYLSVFLFFLTFSTLSSCSSQSWLPKIVWTYWEQPLKEDDQLMMSFYNNHKQKLQGWQIRHMNQENMWSWLDAIPGLQDIFYGVEFQSQVNAKRADLVRLAIMHHYGGVWMDYTMILTENLDWILNMKNNQLVVNKNGQSPDMFILQSSQHGDRDEGFDSETKQKFLLYPTFEIFFMAAKPGNRFAKDWMDYFVQVVKNSYRKYGTEDKKSWVYDVSKEQNLKTGGFAQGWQKYFQCSISASVLLQKKQRELDSKYNNGQTTFRELAVKKYNIWVMGTGSTAYTIHNMAKFQLKPIVNILAQSDIEYLKSINTFPRYFVKIYHQIFYYLKLYFINQELKKQIECPDNYYIYQNSILYRYLLQRNAKKFYQNQVSKYSYNRNCIMPIDVINYVAKEKQLQKIRQDQAKKQLVQDANQRGFAEGNIIYKLFEKKNEKLQNTLQTMIEQRLKKQLEQEQNIYSQQKTIFRQQIQQKQLKIAVLEKNIAEGQQQMRFHKLLSAIMAGALLFLSFTFCLYYCTNRNKNAPKSTYALQQIDRQQNTFRQLSPTKSAQQSTN